MKKVLTTVLLIFTLMSTEVTMATLSQSGAARTARPVTSGAARPAQQQQQNVPVWLQGAYNQPTMAPQPQPTQPPSNKSARDQLANAGNKRTNALNPAREDRPAWADALQTAWNVASPLLSGPAGVPMMASQLLNLATPQIASLLPNQKDNDQLSEGNPKTNDQMGRMSGRTMFGPGIGPGTLDPSLWDLPSEGGSGGFGSNYGGNWRRGGGGGGGRGGSYDYANDYPAWVKTLMGLNSWNIK